MFLLVICDMKGAHYDFGSLETSKTFHKLLLWFYDKLTICKEISHYDSRLKYMIDLVWVKFQNFPYFEYNIIYILGINTIKIWKLNLALLHKINISVWLYYYTLKVLYSSTQF
jgi:hypothetical protein